MSVKNSAAVALGKKRWQGIAPEEISRRMSELGKLAGLKMSAKQRIARAKKAGLSQGKKKKSALQSKAT